MDYRWIAFGLGAEMVGVSLAAGLIHELCERVRDELEVEHPTRRSSDGGEMTVAARWGRLEMAAPYAQ